MCFGVNLFVHNLGCEVAKLRSCEVAKLRSCEVAKLRSCEVAKLRSLPDAILYVKCFYKTFCTFFARTFITAIGTFIYHWYTLYTVLPYMARFYTEDFYLTR